MNDAKREPAAAKQKGVSRRSLLRGLAATAALRAGPAKAAPESTAERSGAAGGALQPRDARKSLVEAMRRFPLVALGERHQLQEFHDFLTALLFHPDLPGQLTDIVVEFGNARHQDVADRFVRDGLPVANRDLERIWRHTIGGGVRWDAPVYAQFFRTVRALNWQRAPGRRLRVLLGDPPFDPGKVRGPAARDHVQGVTKERDAHYAAVVEREVLAKGRRALLIAGSGHLLRGIGDNFKQPNAATRLEKAHPGKLFVVDPLIVPPGDQRDDLLRRARASTAGWPRPSCALLAGTWLGALVHSARPWINSTAYRALEPAAARYGAQADAVLYLGPGDVLTASRPDPAIYRSGPSAAELRRVSECLSQLGRPTDLVAEGLRQAEAGPSWFARSR